VPPNAFLKFLDLDVVGKFYDFSKTIWHQTEQDEE
jgi:hypothetical protein